MVPTVIGAMRTGQAGPINVGKGWVFEARLEGARLVEGARLSVILGARAWRDEVALWKVFWLWGEPVSRMSEVLFRERPPQTGFQVSLEFMSS